MMKIIEKRILAGTKEEGHLCDLEFCPVVSCQSFYQERNWSFINETLPAYAYIKYLVSGEGTTSAYVDRDLYEYLLDCAMPAKVQYAREFAELKEEAKAERKQPKPRISVKDDETAALRARIAILEAENAALKAASRSKADSKPKVKPSVRTVSDIEYDASRLALTVWIGGKPQRYSRITKTLYQSLLAAKDQKAFIDRNVRPYHSAEKLA
jgi:hypothetical protein